MRQWSNRANRQMIRLLCYAHLYICSFVYLSICPSTIADSPTSFSAEKASFAVKCRGEISPYRVLGIFVLPGETLALQALATTGEKPFRLEASSGTVTQIDTNRWQWSAPKKTGLYPAKIIHPLTQDVIRLNIFVMIPYSDLKGEYLNGYRIGKYPTIPLRQLPIYKPPRGFIEVTPENEETLVSPHFKLKQFLCKQRGDYPKYVVLRERLLLKLELILEKVNEKGYHCDGFHVMSGYRTPHYNRAIGNAKYSRHVWGGAADIFIDVTPKDGIMDDLNHDEVIDYRDAKILYDLINKMYRKKNYIPFVGGLGRYKKTASHGPFVHVDVRGFRARWGD
jgi:hypothetical protein